jgi:glycosyltransferase involved in cell wall biosynthesis
LLRVIAYTGGWNAPSRIFRVQHYRVPLRGFGIEMSECPSAAGLYPPASKWLRPAWALWNLADRAPDTLRSLGYDLVFLQREMLSTYVTWEPLTKKPRVLDVDDAIWVHRRGHFAARLAALSDHIICGNSFLAQEFSRWNPSVTILPTPVDTQTFYPQTGPRDGERPIIGWMGLPSSLRYVYQIEQALARVLGRYPEAVLRIVCGSRPDFRMIPQERVHWIPWTRENEARTIQEMTIGIMPLDDTVFSRGKCSYKMLLYMASGLPVVVSPVGMNAEVLKKGMVGFGPGSEPDWVDNLSQLLSSPKLREQMGKVGRETVVREFSVEALAPRLARVLLHTAGKPFAVAARNPAQPEFGAVDDQSVLKHTSLGEGRASTSIASQGRRGS